VVHGQKGPGEGRRAYETEDGIADFHAAGRHSHITELLRNGTSLPEAKELARHSDVKMTMKYAHIGITDQAKGGGQAAGTRQVCAARALHFRRLSVSFAVIIWQSRRLRKSETPCDDRGFGVDRRHLASGDKMEAAGIEPASCDPLMSASTCVVHRLMSPETGSTNKAWLKPATTKSRVGRSGVGRRQPEFATGLRTPRAGIPQPGLT